MDVGQIITLVVFVVTIIGAVLYLRADATANRVEVLDTKIDTKAAELSAQMQRNHRELLIRLAFHHHGDGRYPV